MLDGANVEAVREVAQNWQDVHDELVGTDGKGGVKKKFDDAVAKVLKGWTGDAAEKFHLQSQKISRNFANGAPYAQATARAMGQAAADLQEALVRYHNIDWGPASRALQAEAENVMMESVAKDGGKTCSPPPPVTFETAPLWAEDMGNMSGKIESWNMVQTDLAAGMSTEQVLAKHNDTTGKHGLPKFLRQTLEASIAMEKLGTSYASKAKELQPPSKSRNKDIPERGGGGGRGGGGSGAGRGLDVGRVDPGADGGISGGRGVPDLKESTAMDSPTRSTTPLPSGQVGTGLDSVNGQQGASPPGSGAGGVGLAGSSGGSSAMSGAVPSMAPGGPAAGGRIAGGAASKGMSAGGGAATGGGPGAGSRSGMAPGMGGAAGGAGGANKAAGGTRGSGSAARRSGGAVGAAQKLGGGPTQGGSGLHRSRGGALADGSRRDGRRGAAGGLGAGGAASGSPNQSAVGKRPEYLGEDEETWVPKRNVAPRVIE